MSRTIVCLLLAAALLGCAGNNKKDDAKNNSAAKRPPDAFEAAAEDPPLTANTRFAAGQLAEAQGDVERALVQYREALKLDPKHQSTLFRMGALYTKTKRFNEAIDTWQQYIKVTN